MEKIIYFEDKELENEERKKDLDSSINNNKVWNVEFFSKKVLEINMSLY